MTIYFFKPITYVYQGLVPQEARKGVGNFFNNLGVPVFKTWLNLLFI